METLLPFLTFALAPKNQPLVEMVLESKALVISCIFFARLHYTGATGWIQLLYHYLCNGIASAVTVACYTVVILNDKPNFAKLF